MNIKFINPGVDYMIQRIMYFQTEDESAFRSEPLYHFYPQLDKAYATSLPFAERKHCCALLAKAVISGETTASGETDRPSGEMPQPPSGEWPQEQQSSELWLLLSCLLVLAAALVFARRFRRRKH